MKLGPPSFAKGPGSAPAYRRGRADRQQGQVGRWGRTSCKGHRFAAGMRLPLISDRLAGGCSCSMATAGKQAGAKHDSEEACLTRQLPAVLAGPEPAVERPERALLIEKSTTVAPRPAQGQRKGLQCCRAAPPAKLPLQVPMLRAATACPPQPARISLTGCKSENGARKSNPLRAPCPVPRPGWL